MKLTECRKGVSGMRRLLGWAVLVLAALLLAMGVYRGLSRGETPAYPAGEGSASLGLVLLDDEDCVYVLAVTDQSPAHLAGLHPGDYILRADGRQVSDTAVLDEIVDAGGGTVEVTVRRQEKELKLTLPCR